MTTRAIQPDATAILGDAPLGEEDLHALMQAVSETTRQLEQTHVALHREVARLKQELADANAQLRRSESLAALGQMAAGIAHEIRNPLGCIQLYAQALDEDLRDRPDQATLCRKISRAVTTLDAIVRDVLLFSRETRVERSPSCARSVMNSALGHCDALLARARIRVDRSGVAPHGFSGDGNLLHQALGNVLRNAIEAMQQHDQNEHRMTLATGRRSIRGISGHATPHVVFSVRDTGPGITDEVRERMFNPFFTTRNAGTGLGLAIVHRIVEAHGGQVRVIVHDAEQRCGTTFELCIPVGDVRNSANGTENELLDEPPLVTVTSERLIPQPLTTPAHG